MSGPKVYFAENYGTSITNQEYNTTVITDNDGVYLTGFFQGPSVNFGGHVLEKKSNIPSNIYKFYIYLIHSFYSLFSSKKKKKFNFCFHSRFKKRY